MVSWLLLQSGKVVSGAWKKSGTGYIKQNRNKTVSFPFLVSLKTFCLQLRPFRFSSHIFCSSLHFSRQHLSYVVYCLLHFPSFCLFCIICFRTYSSLPWWRRRHISTKRLYLSTKLHDVTYRQFIIFVYFFLLDRYLRAQRSARRLASVAPYAACRVRLAADEGK